MYLPFNTTRGHGGPALLKTYSLLILIISSLNWFAVGMPITDGVLSDDCTGNSNVTGNSLQRRGSTTETIHGWVTFEAPSLEDEENRPKNRPYPPKEDIKWMTRKLVNMAGTEVESDKITLQAVPFTTCWNSETGRCNFKVQLSAWPKASEKNVVILTGWVQPPGLRKGSTGFTKEDFSGALLDQSGKKAIVIVTAGEVTAKDVELSTLSDPKFAASAASGKGKLHVGFSKTASQKKFKFDDPPDKIKKRKR